ncbi:MAG: hypothetical protein GWO23_03065, partial [Gammaproteobacteria bacterium]|nr:hypothetical protein [Gammaproteobacteria bacterium]
ADVILEIDGIQTDMASEYLALLRTYPPGEMIELRLLRGEDELDMQVQLAELPQDYAINYFKDVFGLVVAEDLQGIVIEKVLPDSAAAR